MKKVFLMAAFVAVTVGANAQTFGIQVGGNMASLKQEYTAPGVPTVKENSDSKFGFLIGAVAEIPVSSNFTFRPELNFIQKGGKTEESETEDLGGGMTYSYKAEGKSTMSFIELPLNFVYSVPAGTGSLFFGAGPSIGFGIGGKMEGTATVTSNVPGFPSGTETLDADIKFDGKTYDEVDADDNDAHYKSLDFGANLLAGYKMTNGMFITAGYTMGFSNLNPNENEKLQTRGFQIKLGYTFGGNKSAE